MNPLSPEPDFLRWEHHLADGETLAFMAARLFALADTLPGRRVTVDEPSGRDHTVLLSQPRKLKVPELAIVGFFGQKNPAASPDERQALWDIDDSLVAEVSSFEGIISLSCLQLPSGEYGNLVVLEDRAAADHWRSSATHQRAVHEHAPRNYLSIRLHNGTLNRLRVDLALTKYYAFRPEGLWRGEKAHTGLSAALPQI